ncbi:MAG: hypothetical protein SGILL_003441 [Bacillariaceae sp.]
MASTRRISTARSCLWWLCLVALILPILLVSAAKTVKEPRTGIAFDEKVQGLKLDSLGLRTKGPFKVYAVGQYGKTNAGKPNNAFVLKMNMSVNAEKLSSALMDALKPRCKKLKCDANQENEFKEMVLEALPSEGAKSGYTLIFNTSGNKVTLTVNGKMAGKISGKAVAKAFAAIYTDKNTVCVMESVDESSRSEPKPIGFVVTTLIFLAAMVVSTKYTTEFIDGFAVSKLHIYPIKSCAEQSMENAVVTSRGFQGDRIAMVVDEDGVCCTGRDSDKVKLFHVQPTIAFPSCDTMKVTYKGRGSSLEINLLKPQSNLKSYSHNEALGKLLLADLGNASASWIEKSTGIAGCRLTSIHDDENDTDKYERHCAVNPGQGAKVPIVKAPVSLADEAPFLLCNQASLDDLNRRLLQRGHHPVDMRRFRPNLEVIHDSATGKPLKPWIEDTWKKIRIGSVEFFVWQKCGRCTMTTIDRDSLTRAPKGEPLSTLSTFREAARGQRNFGMHLIPDPASLKANDTDADESHLVITVGDAIEVLEYDEDRLQEWETTYGDL